MKLKYLAAACALASVSTGAFAAPINLGEMKESLEIQLETVIEPIFELKFKNIDEDKKSTKRTIKHSLTGGFADATVDVQVVSNLRKVDYEFKLKEDVKLVGKQFEEEYPVMVFFDKKDDAKSNESLTTQGITLDQSRMALNEKNESTVFTLKFVGATTPQARLAGADTYNGAATISVSPKTTSPI